MKAKRFEITLVVAGGIAVLVVQIFFKNTQWWLSFARIMDEYDLILLPSAALIGLGIGLGLASWKRFRLPAAERGEWDRQRLIMLRKAGWPPSWLHVGIPLVVGLAFAAVGALKLAAGALVFALAIELLRWHYAGLQTRTTRRV